MTDLELYEDHQIRRALAQIKAAPMTVGDAWKIGGTIDWGAVALSVNTAAELGLAPRTNYKFFPVIKGQVYPMAEICRVLLFRHGGDLTVTCDTAQQCTVVVTGPNGKTFPPFTVTAQEATAAGWGKPSGLATSDIRSILRARASIRAIKLNCPQVLAGPPPERWGDWHNDPGPEVDGAEPSSGPAPLAASTRQEAVSGTTRQKIRAAIDRLTPGQRHSVAELVADRPAPPARQRRLRPRPRHGRHRRHPRHDRRRRATPRPLRSRARSRPRTRRRQLQVRGARRPGQAVRMMLAVLLLIVAAGALVLYAARTP